MLLFLALALGLWLLGRHFGTPFRARFLSIALLYIAVLILLILLPGDNPLSVALGGSVRSWLAVGLIGGLIYVYSVGLKRLRKKVRPENAVSEQVAQSDAPFSDAELDRYARHFVLREIGGPGQRRLKDARVLVVGAGGLGSPALLYLAAAGVGTVGVIDDDEVENANLQRQVIHSDETVGMPKVFSAERAMKALNPHVIVRPYHRKLTAEIAADLFGDYDLVLDGTDNFETRYLVNQACVERGIPLISGAISQWEGQVSVFDPARGAPCYRCIFPEPPAPELAPSCAEAGVMGPLPGVVGSMMAVEAVKVITDAGAPLCGEMLIYDGLYGESRKIGVKRRADCPVCAGT